jgi:alcohol dehydrogenase class IV
MNIEFNYFNPTRIYFGCGKRTLLPEVIKKEGWHSGVMVVDHALKTLPSIRKIEADLSAAGVTISIGYCDMAEPSYTFLDKFRRQFDGRQFDFVIGIGGGSALDTAKAVAVLINNRASAITYRGFDKMTDTVLPIIALPTTAGTGSEVTPNASFVDTAEKRKLGINGEAVRPRIAILDPELTVSCPVRPSVSAAVDSIVHAIEAYVARKTNPIARFYAREGFRRVYNNLERLVKTPDDVGIRTELLYGAHLAGVALMHSGTGPAAAMSYPLGTLYGVPHGVGGAIFLPSVVKFNVDQGYLDYSDLYDIMDLSDPKLPREIRARQFCDRLLNTWKVIGVPGDLRELNIDSELFVAQTMQLGGALEQNPIQFGAPEVKTVLSLLGAKAT